MSESEKTTEENQKLLEAAVKNNDVAFLTAALEKGADVNSKNAAGNTLLHVAIDNEVGYECLELLMKKGASGSIMNKVGLKPLHVIPPASFRTFLNLFKLEKYFDAKDYQGNTIMHLLMMTGTDKETMQEILSNLSSLKVDFNTKNNYGQTPLHIVAGRLSGEENLDFILSNFNELNLLQKDFREDTFLHCYLKSFGGASELELLNNILDRKYECCSGVTLKQLLESKNDTMETPFYLYIDRGGLYNDIQLQLCEKFHKAGADFNCCDIKGETVLHNLFVCEEDQLPVIEFMVRSGADLNKKNIFLESPIFHTNSVQIMELFLDNGADVNAQNKIGKNVLIAKLLEDDLNAELIEMLLEHGADVNAVDAHGNTCLHYAAWRNISKEVVQLLKKAGANIRKNKVKELPCYVAVKCLHVDLMDEFCICQPGRHRVQVPCKGAMVKIEELQQDNVMKACTVSKEISEFEISELLKLPHIGSVEFDGEAEELKQAVTKVVADICQSMGERDKLLRNTVFQSGSVGEKTKVGLPDEFDFVCLIDFISKVCELDEEKSEEDAGYAYVRLKEEHRGEQCRQVFDTQCYLDSEMIYLRFVSVLKDVIHTPDFYRHPNLAFGFDQTKEGPQIPNCKFSLRWTGAVFKDVTVDVDLVPACRIPSWWPSGTNLDSIAGNTDMLKNDGVLLLLQITVNEDFDPEAKLRVSAQSAEKAHMEALPQVARDAYMASKILCSDRICPKIQLSEDPSYLKTFLTSYMLKNCMFHAFEEVLTEKNVRSPELSESTLHDFVVRIFKKLLSFSESESLPAFVFSWQNTFTFQEGPAADLFSNRTKQDCICRKLYAKLILNMLGEDVDFKDCDMQVVTDPL